jgi:hypothetical protein
MKTREFDPNLIDLQDEELNESFLQLGFESTTEFTAYFRTGISEMDLDAPLMTGSNSSMPRIRASF